MVGPVVGRVTDCSARLLLETDVSAELLIEVPPPFFFPLLFPVTLLSKHLLSCCWPSPLAFPRPPFRITRGLHDPTLSLTAASAL